MFPSCSHTPNGFLLVTGAGIPPATLDERPALDVAPTLLALVGAPIPSHLTGQAIAGIVARPDGLPGHSSQRNQRAAASGAATAHTRSTTSSPTGNARPGVSTARTVSDSAAAGSNFATASTASGSLASG